MVRLGPRGFTLIELLVVITIIGILAGIIVTSFSSVRANGRDAKRLTELKEISLALQLFYRNNGRYPTENLPDNANAGVTGHICNDSSSCPGGINGILQPYFSSMPTDPSHNPAKKFYYYYDGSANCGTGSPAPQIAILFAKVENSANSNFAETAAFCGGPPPILGGEGRLGDTTSYNIILGKGQ